MLAGPDTSTLDRQGGVVCVVSVVHVMRVIQDLPTPTSLHKVVTLRSTKEGDCLALSGTPTTRDMSILTAGESMGIKKRPSKPLY
ncbi:hypothetical protein E2C01_099665 [Portunus trituberculatus]|uniref:Uncharacterized protein n=1 Tax=Portunus trituberculatus TaxID=210409 RepID=A0A5B7KA80_PORTR|nr:hypothetical protein [Portunus trituberculatus]